jgi:hypothetical protein
MPHIARNREVRVVSIHDDALRGLQERFEQIREAASATDARTNQARLAVRDVAAGYRHLRNRLVEDPELLALLHETFGVPLERACVALGEPGP